MSNYKRRLKRYLSFILVVSLLLGLIPQSAYATGVVDMQEEMSEEKQEEKDILSYYGMVAQKNNIQLSCGQAYFNTNLYSGKDFSCSGSKVTIDGKIETAGKVNAWCHEFTVAEQTEKAEPIILPDIRSGIESKSDVWEEQEYYMNVNGEEVCNGFKRSASGIQISGTHFIGDCYLMAEDSIQYSVQSLNKDGGRVVLYSENGDINISGSDIVINGIIAAPNGTVRFSANNVTINGRIYASGIEMSGTSFNMYSSEEDLELIRDEADIVKIYDKAADFEEGTVEGIAIGEDVITLKETTYPSEIMMKEYNQDEDGVSAKVTLDADRLQQGENQFHYNIQLDGGFSELLGESNVDAYFSSYNGHLYAFINKSHYWDDAKRFCEESGGHLATISSPEEMEILTEMVSSRSSYTAIGFTDAEKEGEWKWVTGEDVVYTNWNGGEPNNSFGSGQNHAYIYSNGKWDDGYDYIMSPFLCEWEMDANLTMPSGRELELVIEVNGTVAKNGDFECLENKDGTTTVVYFAEKLMPTDKISLDMDIAVSGTEGYQSVIRDSYYVYYDSEGKSHRIEMGDLWLPVKKYTESGTWKTIYDSEKNGTQWNKLWWEAEQAGDSVVSAHVRAYDTEDGEITEADVCNKEALEGIKGRYIEIEMTLQQGQDYRSPVVDKVFLVSKHASEEITVADQLPTGELIGNETIREGSIQSAYFKLSGGLQQISSDVQWSITTVTGETEDYEINKITPHLVQYQINSPGSYLLKAVTYYGGEEVTASKKIVVRKTEERTNIESLVEDKEIYLVLDMPDYGQSGETVIGNIYMPGGEQIESIRVLQDGTEIPSEINGAFQATLPKTKESVTFDIYLTFQNKKEVYRQHVVYIDDIAPVVRITPEKESYSNGEDGTFQLTIEDESPIKSIVVSFDESEVLYEGHNVITINKLMEGEHTLKAVVTDIAGNQTEEVCAFTVVGEAESEEIPNQDFGILLNRTSASVGSSIGVSMVLSDRIDVSTVKVVMGNETLEIVEGRGSYVPDAPGTYTFIATAQDAEGNGYTAEAVCQVYDTSDLTPPTITMLSPEQDAVITDVTDIVGSVSDDKALDYYTLEYAEEGSDSYTLLAKETEPKEKETLGTLDTTMLYNGRYILKLTVSMTVLKCKKKAFEFCKFFDAS